MGSNDARTGMPPGIPKGAMCVQRLDDSLKSAIHTSYRISLRSSSMPEPRDPLLKVVFLLRVSDNIRRLFWFLAGRTPQETRLGTHWFEVGADAFLSNDPSAGSPTETLLRLLLPLNEQV